MRVFVWSILISITYLVASIEFAKPIQASIGERLYMAGIQINDLSSTDALILKAPKGVYLSGNIKLVSSDGFQIQTYAKVESKNNLNDTLTIKFSDIDLNPFDEITLYAHVYIASYSKEGAKDFMIWYHGRNYHGTPLYIGNFKSLEGLDDQYIQPGQIFHAVPKNAIGIVKYSSSNPNIAKVDAAGTVKVSDSVNCADSVIISAIDTSSGLEVETKLKIAEYALKISDNIISSSERRCYKKDEKVTLSPDLKMNSRVKQWTKDGAIFNWPNPASRNDPITISMDNHHHITLELEYPSFEIQANAKHGVITLFPDKKSYVLGEHAIAKVSCNKGYKFYKFSDEFIQNNKIYNSEIDLKVTGNMRIEAVCVPSFEAPKISQVSINKGSIVLGEKLIINVHSLNTTLITLFIDKYRVDTMNLIDTTDFFTYDLSGKLSEGDHTLRLEALNTSSNIFDKTEEIDFHVRYEYSEKCNENLIKRANMPHQWFLLGVLEGGCTKKGVIANSSKDTLIYSYDSKSQNWRSSKDFSLSRGSSVWIKREDLREDPSIEKPVTNTIFSNIDDKSCLQEIKNRLHSGYNLVTPLLHGCTRGGLKKEGLLEVYKFDNKRKRFTHVSEETFYVGDGLWIFKGMPTH